MKTIFICLMILSGICLEAQTSVRLIPVIQNLSSPTCIAFDGSGDFYITQRSGSIVLADSSGNVNPVHFLDISDRVKSDFQEQGLLGIALHPNFTQNGWFFVHYTGTGDSIHISRFSRDPSDTTKALPGSEVKLMTIYHPFQNHNGGELQFGPDHFLYIGPGDGGSAGDPGNRAQSKSELLGKILRIDVNNGNPYAIPSDNPFVSDPTARHEIWALGLRNPWRFSFDRQTGDMWIGDVGQGTREEIDLEMAGSPGGNNYGWRCYEGTLPYNTTGCLPQTNYVFPVYEYAHDASPCWSVTGGYRYRGTADPGMSGKYFFTDYCKDVLWSLHDSSGNWAVKTEGTYTGNGFSTFGEDRHGNLYIAGLTSGKIFRIADSTSSGISDHSEITVKIYPDPFSEEINIEPGIPGNYVLTISDLSGRKMMVRKISGNAKLFTGNLSPGIYLLHVQNDRHFFTGKITKK